MRSWVLLGMAGSFSSLFVGVGLSGAEPQGRPSSRESVPSAIASATNDESTHSSLWSSKPTFEKPTVGRWGDPLPEGAYARLGSHRLRHRSGISCLAYSPNGRFLISGGDDGVVSVWDAQTGQARRKLTGPWDRMLSLAVSNDGQFLAGGTREGKVLLWRLFESDQPTILLDEQHYPMLVAFAHDGKTLVSTGRTPSIHAWSVATGKEIRQWNGHESRIVALAVSPDGKTLATTSYDRQIILWDIDTGKSTHRFSTPNAAVPSALAFSADNKKLAISSYSGGLRVTLWNCETKTFEPDLPASDLVYGGPIVFSSDGDLLIYAGGTYLRTDEGLHRYQSWFHVVDLAQQKIVRRIEGPGHEIRALVLSPDNKTLAASGSGSAVGLWNVADGTAQLDRGHRGPIAAVAISLDGGKVASLSADDHQLRLWDRRDGRLLQHAKVPNASGAGLAFAPENRLLLAAPKQQQWNLETFTSRGWGQEPLGKQLADKVHAVATSAHGELLGAVTSTQEVIVMRRRQGRVVGRLSFDDETYFRPRLPLALSNDGRLVAMVGNNQTVRLYELISGDEVGQMRGLDESPAALVFDPTNRYLAVASGSTVLFWDLAKRSPVGQVETGQGEVTALAFSADGRWLVTGGQDTTCLVWSGRPEENARLDQKATKLRTHIDPVPMMASKGKASAWLGLDHPSAAHAERAHWQKELEGSALVEHLAKLLHPPGSDDQLKRLTRWIKLLDAPEHPARQWAESRLSQHLTEAEPLLRVTLSQTPSPEARLRIERLLQKVEGRGPELHRPLLPALRALWVLNRLGTPEAVAVLEKTSASASSEIVRQTASDLLDRRDRLNQVVR